MIGQILIIGLGIWLLYKWVMKIYLYWFGTMDNIFGDELYRWQLKDVVHVKFGHGEYSGYTNYHIARFDPDGVWVVTQYDLGYHDFKNTEYWKFLRAGRIKRNVTYEERESKRNKQEKIASSIDSSYNDRLVMIQKEYEEIYNEQEQKAKLSDGV